MDITFSIKEALMYGFRATWKHIKLIAFIWLIVIGVGVVFELLTEPLVRGYFCCVDCNVIFTTKFLWYIFARLIVYTVFIIIELGILRIALDIFDTGTSKLNRMFSVVALIIPYIIATLLFRLITFVGFILLIIPGIIWSIKYNFYDLFIVDSQCSVQDAFKKSAMLTTGYKWHLFLFMLTCIAVCMVGIITIIGIFFVFPAVYLARVYVFRKLLGHEIQEQVDVMKYW